MRWLRAIKRMTEQVRPPKTLVILCGLVERPLMPDGVAGWGSPHEWRWCPFDSLILLKHPMRQDSIF
jgi:hypothetical protein